jgi:hypothetical protein
MKSAVDFSIEIKNYSNPVIDGKNALRHDRTSSVRLNNGLTQDEFNAVSVFSIVKAQASADILLKYAMSSFESKQISKKIAALLIRGALIDFGGGKMYNESQPKLIDFMKSLGKTSFMYEDEIQAFQSLDQQLSIYRSGRENSMFWTLSKDSAKMVFAKNKCLNFIYCGTIEKKDVLFFAQHDNGLIVCDPWQVKQLIKMPV